MTALLYSIAAYLVGSISFAIVLSKVFGMQDPRSYGSNNPGATNMLRSGRKKIALLTLLGDGFKGFLPGFPLSVGNQRRGPQGVAAAAFDAVQGMLQQNLVAALQGDIGQGQAQTWR